MGKEIAVHGDESFNSLLSPYRPSWIAVELRLEGSVMTRLRLEYSWVAVGQSRHYAITVGLRLGDFVETRLRWGCGWTAPM